MDAVEAVRGWIDGWVRGWSTHDPDPIAALYTEDALFVSHPFRTALRGAAGAAEYVRSAFAEEDTVEFWFAEPVMAGARAAVEYWAHFTTGGGEQTLAGITALVFAADGKCREHRDYWAIRDGRLERAGGWTKPIAAHGRYG